jgi:serine/threonine-protein kinase
VEGRDRLPGAPGYRALLLGPFEVEREGCPLAAGSWQHRVQTLFELLITATDRQRRRDDLIDILWPEADPDAATGNLRILAHRLRVTLGGNPSPVLSHNGWVALNPAYRWSLDLEEMEALVANAHGDLERLQAATALMRGEPLVENRYEDWAIPLIERATRTWRDACLQLAAIYAMRGRHDESAAWSERVLGADPLDEDALRSLLTALARAGRPADALRRFETFRMHLHDELDVDPSAETEVVVAAIRSQVDGEGGAGAPAIAHAIGGEPEEPLVGRVQELERALLLADAVGNGAGRLLLISGETGAGKTRLAQEILLRLRDRGFLVVAVRCYSRERAVPFAPFLDVLPQIHSAVSQAVREETAMKWPHLALLLPHGSALPPGAEPDEPDEQFTLFRDCAGFLARASQERPLALFIDDFHWADEGSIDLLRFLARELRGRAVYLLSAYRDGDISRGHPLSGAVRDLVREGVVDRALLGRLGPEETTELITALIANGAPPQDFCEFSFRRTRGNPLLVRRLVQALGGRYALHRQIGAGGMGRVFEAVDRQTGERVAVKLMFARKEAEPKALLRFQQEGALLLGMSHPNIVRVYGSFVEEHASCIAMELLEGSTLAEVLREGPLPLERAKSLILQILSALEAAHERGIVHRDVKPQNVMVLNGDQVKVMDFGVARLARSGTDTTLTTTGMSLGTPLYMAPEQIHGDKVDARTDLYAAGALLYHMLTGRRPFEAEDPLAVAFMQVNEAPVTLRALRPRLPGEWDAVVLRALAKSPADRFQSAVAMGRAVAALPTIENSTEYVPESPTVPPPVSRERTEAAPTGGRRRTAVLGLGAAVAVFAAVLAPRVLSYQSQPAVRFNGPDSVAVNAQGTVYVADQGNNRIVELSPSGTQVGAFGTFGKGTLQFSNPGSLAFAPSGTLYVADDSNNRIIALRSGRETYSARYDAGSLAVSPDNTLYASDFGNNRIWRFSPSFQPLPTLAVPFTTVGAQEYPAQLAIDQIGNLYIADREHNSIVKVSRTGKVAARFGRFGTSMPTKSNPLFNGPSGVAVDNRGRVYVADTGNDRLEILSPAGRVLRLVRLSGSPVSVAVDSQGGIYLADYYGNQIIKVSSRGRVLWSVGSS